MKLTPSEIKDNRIRFIWALEREPEQCFGLLFEGTVPCAAGVGVRLFTGISSDVEVRRYYESRPTAPALYGILAENLGIPTVSEDNAISVDTIWRLNDGAKFTMQQIAKILRIVWEF